jgi:hypothetical protein
VKERSIIRLKLLIPVAALWLLPAAFAGEYSPIEMCFYINSLDLNHSCAELGIGGNLNPSFEYVGSATILTPRADVGNSTNNTDNTLGSGGTQSFDLGDPNLLGSSFQTYLETFYSQFLGMNLNGSDGAGLGMNAAFLSGNGLSDLGRFFIFDASGGSGSGSGGTNNNTVTFVCDTCGTTGDTGGGGGGTITGSAVPEPSTLGLLLAGLGLLAWRVRRRAA